MPNCCDNCAHWKRQAARPEALTNSLGECRANPPPVSYNWPRTHSTDYCSCHSSKETGNRKAETGARKTEGGRRKADELPIG